MSSVIKNMQHLTKFLARVDKTNPPKAGDSWRILGMRGGGRVNGCWYEPTQCYLRALKCNPKLCEAWNDLANELAHNTYEGNGEVVINDICYDKRACLEESLSIDPAQPGEWNNLGVVGGGKVGTRAYSRPECYDQAIRRDPDNAAPWVNLGHYGGGMVRGSHYSTHRCYEQALQIRPMDAELWLKLGDVGGGTVRGSRHSASHCYLMCLDVDLKTGVQDAKGTLGITSSAASALTAALRLLLGEAPGGGAATAPDTKTAAAALSILDEGSKVHQRCLERLRRVLCRLDPDCHPRYNEAVMLSDHYASQTAAKLIREEEAKRHKRIKRKEQQREKRKARLQEMQRLHRKQEEQQLLLQQQKEEEEEQQQKEEEEEQQQKEEEEEQQQKKKEEERAAKGLERQREQEAQRQEEEKRRKELRQRARQLLQQQKKEQEARRLQEQLQEEDRRKELARQTEQEQQLQRRRTQEALERARDQICQQQKKRSQGAAKIQESFNRAPGPPNKQVARIGRCKGPPLLWKDLALYTTKEWYPLLDRHQTGQASFFSNVSLMSPSQSGLALQVA